MIEKKEYRQAQLDQTTIFLIWFSEYLEENEPHAVQDINTIKDALDLLPDNIEELEEK